MHNGCDSSASVHLHLLTYRSICDQMPTSLFIMAILGRVMAFSVNKIREKCAPKVKFWAFETNVLSFICHKWQSWCVLPLTTPDHIECLWVNNISDVEVARFIWPPINPIPCKWTHDIEFATISAKCPHLNVSTLQRCGFCLGCVTSAPH